MMLIIYLLSFQDLYQNSKPLLTINVVSDGTQNNLFLCDVQEKLRFNSVTPSLLGFLNVGVLLFQKSLRRGEAKEERFQ